MQCECVSAHGVHDAVKRHASAGEVSVDIGAFAALAYMLCDEALKRTAIKDMRLQPLRSGKGCAADAHAPSLRIAIFQSEHADHLALKN